MLARSGGCYEKWMERSRLEQLTDADSPITYGVVKPGSPGNVLFIRGGTIARRPKSSVISSGRSQKEISQQYKRTLLRGGELLICLVGQPGQVAVAPFLSSRGELARQVGLIRLNLTFRRSGVDYPRISLRAKSGGLQRRRSCNRRRYWTARLPSQMAVAGLFAQASQASSRPKSSAQSAARG